MYNSKAAKCNLKIETLVQRISNKSLLNKNIANTTSTTHMIFGGQPTTPITPLDSSNSNKSVSPLDDSNSNMDDQRVTSLIGSKSNTTEQSTTPITLLDNSNSSKSVTPLDDSDSNMDDQHVTSLIGSKSNTTEQHTTPTTPLYNSNSSKTITQLDDRTSNMNNQDKTPIIGNNTNIPVCTPTPPLIGSKSNTTDQPTTPITPLYNSNSSKSVTPLDRNLNIIDQTTPLIVKPTFTILQFNKEIKVESQIDSNSLLQIYYSLIQSNDLKDHEEVSIIENSSNYAFNKSEMDQIMKNNKHIILLEKISDVPQFLYIKIEPAIIFTY